ncbi:MAG: hypothetical protein ACXAES_17130 [Promethearchaeota archaeon]
MGDYQQLKAVLDTHLLYNRTEGEARSEPRQSHGRNPTLKKHWTISIIIIIII